MTARADRLSVRYLFQAPIEPQQAGRERLPKDLTRLLVSVEAPSTSIGRAIRFLATLLQRSSRQYEHVFVQPIASFVDLKDCAATLQGKGMWTAYDKDFMEQKTGHPRRLTVKCLTPTQVEDALAVLRAEHLVFFWGREYEAGNHFENLGEWYEYPRFLDRHRLFAFRENTDLCFDFLGFRDDVLDVLLTALKIESEMSPQA